MELDLQYERTRLDNGLEVIFHQDPSLPLVVVNIWYYVGSKDEPRGRSGFAHLFEHLMFMGTERVPGTTFDTIMEEGGGSNNASTSRDRTNYYCSGPSNLLPTLLWLEADRMESLGASMNQEKLDLQRDVVRNERRQSYENRPYGSAWLIMPELEYPAGHPYHIPVIGSHEDLVAATVEDVKEFFDTWYRPNNACLVVGGDFELAAAREMVEDLFAGIPAGPRPQHASAPPATLDRCVRETISDDVPAPRTIMAWHSPAHFAPCDAECDLIASLLTSGAPSRLQQALMYKNRLVQDVSAFQQSGRLGSSLTITATALPDISLDTIEAIIDTECARLANEGPTEEEVLRCVTSYEAAFVRGLENLQDRADLLNTYNDVHGDAGAVERDLLRYRTSTPAMIGKVARDVLQPEHRVILRVVPRSAPVSSPRQPVLSRDTRPEAGSPVAWEPPAPAVLSAGGTREAWVVRRDTVPLANFHILVDGGTTEDPPRLLGLHALLAECMLEGAGDRNAALLDTDLDLLGAELGAATRRENMAVSVSTLSRNLEQTLEITQDVLQRPRLEKEDFERVRETRLAALLHRRTMPQQIAALAATRTLFCDDHPWGRPFSGFSSTVGAITLEDVHATSESFRSNLAQARVVVTGDIDAAHFSKSVATVLGEPASSPKESEERALAFPEPAPLRVYLVHKADAPQTVIRFYSLAEPITSDLTPALWLANTIFGGSFTSRLNLSLREKHGFTYGASSAFMQGARIGTFASASNVKATTTGDALREFFNEFARMRDGDITAEELEKARATQRTQTVKSFEEVSGVTSTYAALAASRLPPDVITNIHARMKSVTTDELNSAAHRYMTADTGVLILVGDLATCQTALAPLDLPAPVQLDTDGDPL